MHGSLQVLVMVNEYRNDTIVNVYKNADASAKQRTQAGFELVTATVRFLGFGSDGSKNQAPAQRGIFLGGGLDSNTDGTGKCSKFIDADRKEYVIGCCFEMENRKGAVMVRELMQLLGTLSFCASIVNPIRPCLRSGFDLIRGAKIHARVRLSREFRADLAGIRRLLADAAPRMMLTRHPLTTTFGSWDASTEWGMGGFLDGDVFSVSWESVASWPNTPSFYPSWDSSEKSQIAYLELFAGYWFLRKWAKRLSGWTALVFTDNKNVQTWLTKLTGPGYIIPLLKQIRSILVKYDVCLLVEWLPSAKNVLSDCLSRDDWPGFREALRQWTNVPFISDDMEDWQIDPGVVRELERQFGLFDVDACVDKFRTNSHCIRSWNEEDNCLVQDWAGLNVFCNAPFSKLEQVLHRFLACKRASPRGTAAVFILPCWVQEPFYELFLANSDTLSVVRRWPAGSPLFTAPVPAGLGGGRRFVGTTSWPVIAVRASPM